MPTQTAKVSSNNLFIGNGVVDAKLLKPRSEEFRDYGCRENLQRPGALGGNATKPEVPT